MEHVTVEDFFNFIFFNTIMNDQRWWQWVMFLMLSDWVTLKGT